MLFLCLRHCSVDECKNEAYYRECESDQDRCAVALSFCILAGHDHRSEYPGYAECDKHDTVVTPLFFAPNWSAVNAGKIPINAPKQKPTKQTPRIKSVFDGSPIPDFHTRANPITARTKQITRVLILPSLSEINPQSTRPAAFA